MILKLTLQHEGQCFEGVVELLPQRQQEVLKVASESFPIICAKCGKASTVPFKPQFHSKVFCADCYTPGVKR